jgi:hypothetical protein
LEVLWFDRNFKKIDCKFENLMMRPQILEMSTTYEIGNITTILKISSAAFTLNILPVITTDEELANITLNL